MPDELDLHRRLRRRRNTLPIFVTAGLAALVLAGGLTLLVSSPDEPKPGLGPVGTGPAVPPPALDPSSLSATTTSAPAEVPVEPPRIAAPQPASETPETGAVPAPAQEAGSTTSLAPPQSAPEPQSTLQLPAERAPAPPDLAPKAELTPSAAPQPAPEPVPQAASPPEQSHVAHAKPEAPGREDAPPPNPTVAPPPRPEVAAISPTEVAALLKRARALIGVGDIAGARRVLERAASAKEGSVLFALAETYDPAMLAQWGVVGMRPNVERARVLYQQALEHGIGQAGQRLTALP